MVGLGLYYVGMAATQMRQSPLGAAIAAFLSTGLFLMGGASLRMVFGRRPAPAPAPASEPAPAAPRRLEAAPEVVRV